MICAGERFNFARKTMAKTPRKVQIDYAQQLFVRAGMTQKEVASLVGVTEKSISQWKEKYNWEALKTSFVITRDQELRRIYTQISDLNDAIESRDPGRKHPTPSEADILSKLASAAKSLEVNTSVATIIDVSVELLEWLRTIDFNKSKEIAQYFDSFIKYKISQ